MQLPGQESGIFPKWNLSITLVCSMLTQITHQQSTFFCLKGMVTKFCTMQSTYSCGPTNTGPGPLSVHDVGQFRLLSWWDSFWSTTFLIDVQLSGIHFWTQLNWLALIIDVQLSGIHSGYFWTQLN